jgi:hypothetical protein
MMSGGGVDHRVEPAIFLASNGKHATQIIQTRSIECILTVLVKPDVRLGSEII